MDVEKTIQINEENHYNCENNEHPPYLQINQLENKDLVFGKIPYYYNECKCLCQCIDNLRSQMTLNELNRNEEVKFNGQKIFVTMTNTKKYVYYVRRETIDVILMNKEYNQYSYSFMYDGIHGELLFYITRKKKHQKDEDGLIDPFVCMIRWNHNIMDINKENVKMYMKIIVDCCNSLMGNTNPLKKNNT